MWRSVLALFGWVTWMEGEVEGYPTSAPVTREEYLSRVMPLTGEIGLRWDAPSRKFWAEVVTLMADKQDQLSASDQSDTQRIPEIPRKLGMTHCLGQSLFAKAGRKFRCVCPVALACMWRRLGLAWSAMKPWLTAGLMLFVAVGRAAELPSKTDVSLLQEVARAQERGLDWLVKQQQPDGSWNQHPGITGLAVTALARSGKALRAEQQAALERGVKYILANAKPNGAIYGGGETDKYPNYSTAICTMALVATGDPRHRDVIRRARVFLLDSQFDETEDTPPGSPSFGGIGYGRRQRPDLSNMSWALEALKLTEQFEVKDPEAPKPATKLHWERAVQFLQRCQNLPSHNDQPWAKKAGDADLGGFIYMPGDPAKGIPPVSFADEEITDEKTPLRSYGSMSYAGLKSYIYADLKPDDPRVTAVVQWLGHNYTVDENPGLGVQGLYYYYQMMAKALTALGADTFQAADGTAHDWRYELMKKLVTLQKADGYWQNENNRWWENDRVLVTTYSVLVLEILQQRRYR